MKRRLTALILAVTLVFGLAACSNQSETTDAQSKEDAASEEEAESTETAESEEVLEASFSVMLPVNTMPSEENEPGWYHMIEAFKEAYPNYSIEIVTAGQNSDDYNAAVQMAAAADNLSDLTYCSNGYVSIWTNSGLTLNLEEYMDAEFFDRFVAGAVEGTNQYNAVDGVYALPCRTEVQGWLYNTDLFEQCNLDIPETWDDFLNCVAVFRENGITPISHGATDIWAIWGYHTMFNNNGLTYETAQQLQNGELKFKDCEPFITTFNHIAELAEAGAYNEDVATTSNDIAMARFAAGEAAMYCTYDTSHYNLTAMKETGESDIVDHSVFDFGPAFEDGVGLDNFVGNRSYGWTLIPSAKAAEDEGTLQAILTFLDFFFSEEGTAIWQESCVPATIYTTTDNVADNMLVNSIYEAYTEDIVPAQDLTQAWFDQSIKPTYRNCVTGLICGTISVEEALEMMQDWADTM